MNNICQIYVRKFLKKRSKKSEIVVLVALLAVLLLPLTHLLSGCAVVYSYIRCVQVHRVRVILN